jgi:predicted permease
MRGKETQIMELKGVYTQLGILFLLMFFGYILGKIKVITSAGIEAFSKFIVKVALPAIIISGMIIPLTPEKLYKATYILMLSVATYGLAYIVAIISSKLLVKDKSERGVYSFALVFSNAGFMGYPVLQAMFGKEAIFYAAVYNMTFNILLYTLGIKLLDTGKNEKNKFSLKFLINPGIIASIIGFILFMAQLPLPQFLTGAINYVGSLCTPLSMITIGAMLSSLPLKKMLTGIKVYEFSFIRLLVLPILTVILLKIVLRVDDPWLIAVPVIVAGMPVASNTAMMAKEYGNNPEIASQTILVSTLFSCITIPLLTYLL